MSQNEDPPLSAAEATNPNLTAAAPGTTGVLLMPISDTSVVKLLTEQEWQACAALTHATPPAFDELTKRLHALERHPDYEYDSVEHQRKSCGDSNPPEGEGWEDNYDCDFGVTRGDYTEYHHWRRLKSFQLTDEPNVWNLEPIQLPKLNLADWNAYLAELMKELSDRDDWLTELALPTTTIESLLESTYGKGAYRTQDDQLYLVWEVTQLLLITCLTTGKVNFRSRLGNGSWGRLYEWGKQLSLPINMLEVRTQVPKLLT